MTQELIPVSQEIAEVFEEKLSKTFFRDPKTFISTYNAGLINRSNEDVNDYLNELLATYKGLEVRKQEITFLTRNEIAVEEILVAATAYKALFQIKRIVNDAVEAESITYDTALTINGLGAVSFSKNDGESEDLQGVRHGKLSEAVSAKLRTLLGVSDEFGDYTVIANDVLNVDEAPVEEASHFLA